MSNPSNYQLLLDIQNICNRLEDKMDKRIGLAEGRLDKVESKTDNMLGKIGIGVIVISAVISTSILAIYNWVRARFA